MFFSQDWRERVKAENPDASFGMYASELDCLTLLIICCMVGEIGKLLGARWKELDEEEKKPYIDQAARDKERAEKEKKAYDVSSSACT